MTMVQQRGVGMSSDPNAWPSGNLDYWHCHWSYRHWLVMHSMEGHVLMRMNGIELLASVGRVQKDTFCQMVSFYAVLREMVLLLAVSEPLGYIMDFL